MKTAGVTVDRGLPSKTILARQTRASMTKAPDFIICVDRSSAEDLSQLRVGVTKHTVLTELGDKWTSRSSPLTSNPRPGSMKSVACQRLPPSTMPSTVPGHRQTQPRTQDKMHTT